MTVYASANVLLLPIDLVVVQFGDLLRSRRILRAFVRPHLNETREPQGHTFAVVNDADSGLMCRANRNVCRSHFPNLPTTHPQMTLCPPVDNDAYLVPVQPHIRDVLVGIPIVRPGDLTIARVRTSSKQMKGLPRSTDLQNMGFHVGSEFLQNLVGESEAQPSAVATSKPQRRVPSSNLADRLELLAVRVVHSKQVATVTSCPLPLAVIRS